MKTTTSKHTWTKIEDFDFMGNTRHYLGEYRAAFHPEYRGLEVVTEKVKTGETRSSIDSRGRCRDTPITRVRHTIYICFGPYGEAVCEESLPFGTTLSQAKAAAIEAARQINADTMPMHGGPHGYGKQFDL